MSKKPELLCFSGPCKYLGWKGLKQWCRHPDHCEAIMPTMMFRQMKAGWKCKEWVDWEAKVMPGMAARWPDPVVW